MKAFANWSIRTKIIVIIQLVTLLSIGMGFSVVIFDNIRRFRGDLISEIHMNATLIGEYCTAPMAFYDSAGVEEVLAKAQEVPSIVNGHVYDETGELIAVFNRETEAVVTSLPTGEVSSVFEGGYLHHFQPIEYREHIYGTIYLRASTEQLDKRIRTYLYMMGIVMVGMILLAYLAGSRLQNIISRPILTLADVTKRVSNNKDYSQRIMRRSRDEIGVLYDGFNSMLEQIQAREKERDIAEEQLKEYSGQLEDMVEQRTKELRDAQEELIRKEKLAILGQLAGGVGHELRNPLGAIKNAAYFLNMAVEEPEPEVKETLEIIENEVATSEKIISSLLGFARPKPPTLRKVDVNDVVQVALSRAVVPENVEVVSELGKALPDILADPDQLGPVFDNLILNAVQAMPEGGMLTVTSETRDPEWVTVSVTDTGTGIPDENLDKLFEPLFTTKAKGIGLGLPVTKTLIEGHGGTIEVKSKEGEDSTFTVRLPVGGGEER